MARVWIPLRLRRVLGRFKHGMGRILSTYWTVYVAVRVLPARRDLVLHLGCGDRRIPGAVNIDARRNPAVDLVCDVRRLPYRRNSVARIETFHLIEHLPRAGLEGVLRHWLTLLRPGGVLVIECPDFDRAIQDYAVGNDERLGNIFGLQRFPGDFHLWGWNPHRLRALLLQVGFAHVEEQPPQDYHTETEPCLRLEAHADHDPTG